MKKITVFLILFAGISAFQTVNAEIIDSVTFKGKYGKDVTLYNVCIPNGKCVRDESEYYPWRIRDVSQTKRKMNVIHYCQFYYF